MRFISAVLTTTCCYFSLGGIENALSSMTPYVPVVESKLQLSVVLSAGQVKDVETRIRDLAVFLRDVEPRQLEDGVLIVRDNGWAISEFSVRDRLVEQTQRSARIFTNIKFDQTNWTRSNHPTGDLGYCCELVVDGTVAGSGCLRVQPRWMEKMLPKIGTIPLRNLAIPGTHQSGTYATKLEYLTRYIDCQEEDVFTQLLYGIRSLDLRPGAVPGDRSRFHGYNYRIFHDKFSTNNDLRSILLDIRSFLDIYRKEVVIVDFHEFPKGFDNSSVYLGLAELVEEVLGDHIYRGNLKLLAEATLEEVIKKDERAILTFEKDSNLQREFEPGVEHIWANTDNIKVLEEKLKAGQSHRTPNRLYSTMAQRTAQGAISVIFDRYRGGVRGIAHGDNFVISSWYAEDESFRDNANIIAMDYFASSDIVDICQSINSDRAERSDLLA